MIYFICSPYLRWVFLFPLLLSRVMLSKDSFMLRYSVCHSNFFFLGNYIVKNYIGVQWPFFNKELLMKEIL